MSTPADDNLTPSAAGADSISERLKNAMIWMIIACSVGTVCGRILNCQSVNHGEAVPFFSANDRSRWCTVRSLVDHKTYAIDQILASSDGSQWDTIDKVRHIDSAGNFRFYSSKPTLLPTLAAGGYGLMNLFGVQISEQPFLVIRTLLILMNGIGFGVCLWLISKSVRLLTDNFYTLVFVMVCAGFGTYLSTFGNTLSNHLPAAFCISAALYAVIVIWKVSKARWWFFVSAGLFSGLAAAFELPALSFVAVAAALCLLRSPVRMLTGFMPAFGLVVAAFFGTNFLAHQTWEPAYAHRTDGEILTTVEGDFDGELDRGILPTEFAEKIDEKKHELSVLPRVQKGTWPATGKRWIIDFGSENQLAVVAAANNEYEVRKWKNWYEYPESYWLTTNDKKSAVDKGTDSRAEYILNLTIGHHGIFSLTPIWVLSLGGLFVFLFSRAYGFRIPGFGILLITLVVFAFYVQLPAYDRNYGGWCSCFRWAIWMYPMWLLAMVPLLDAFWQKRIFRDIAVVFLLISVVSACAAANNPWTQPWIQRWFFE